VADDFIAAEKVNKTALIMAHNTLAAIRIRSDLSEGRDAARQQRVLGTRTPFSSDSVERFRASAAVENSEAWSVALERLETCCRAFREEFGSKVIRQQGLVERNKPLCDAALKRFKGEIDPALKDLIKLVPLDHDAAQQAREEAAGCLSAIASDYTWADDFIASEKLYEEAVGMAKDTFGTSRIQDRLAQIRAPARKQRVFGAPISSAPSLSTINGFGLTLYGGSDHDPETNSYSTTHYFVALFVPIFPVGRYRVINAGGSRYQFLGKLPLRNADRWHLGIVAAVLVGLIFSSMINSSQNSTGSSYAPAATSSNGSVSTTRSQLSDLKARIDSGRSQSAALKTQLLPVIDELTRLNGRIEALATELKSLAEQHKAGLEIDIHDYNAKVKTHNALLSKHRVLLTANKNDLHIYEDLEKQDSVLVEQYNSLLK
jgi:hypothetical protein